MSVSTLTFAAVDAWVGLHRTVFADDQGLIVFDGPPLQPPTEQTFFAVGVDQLDAPPHVAVDQGVQTWEDLGAATRQENFTIPSVAMVWAGDVDMSLLRATAKSYIDRLVTALRPSPYGSGDGMLGAVLNQGGGGNGWCGLSVTRIDQVQRQRGAAVYVFYSLECVALV